MVSLLTSHSQNCKLDDASSTLRQRPDKWRYYPWQMANFMEGSIINCGIWMDLGYQHRCENPPWKWIVFQMAHHWFSLLSHIHSCLEVCRCWSLASSQGRKKIPLRTRGNYLQHQIFSMISEIDIQHYTATCFIESVRYPTTTAMRLGKVSVPSQKSEDPHQRQLLPFFQNDFLQTVPLFAMSTPD